MRRRLGGIGLSRARCKGASSNVGDRARRPHLRSAGDGAEPVARLLNMNGILYGTTSVGGNARQYGTIFAILPNGQEKSIYITASDGGNIMAGLTKVGGLLYGTTAEGGVSGQGVVYSLEANTVAPPRGVTDIYSFPYGYSGAWPDSDLTYANGKLYGTTKFGGYQRGESGSVFSLTTTGQRRVLHLFGNTGDGSTPEGDLVAINGKIYGTTHGGGTGCQFECGTVYSVTQGGTETVLHNFTGAPDGWGPNGLINVDGTMYGTTSGGGTGCSCGTVFSIDTAGNEKVLYSFAGAPDGASPNAGLLYAGGTFYGTTTNGGADDCSYVFFGSGCGTVFSITPSGSETLLYSFTGLKFGSRPDGMYPAASLIAVDGKLLGTTEFGGMECATDTPGCGTVFSIEPQTPLRH
ncbi:MAG: choice-of-anchor tandem repeat GloVer-containing protein [Candidatus Cybelea sp.]